MVLQELEGPGVGFRHVPVFTTIEMTARLILAPLLHDYICRTSFRIYLSSISTICKFEQSMRMRYTYRDQERRATETQEQRAEKLQR